MGWVLESPFGPLRQDVDNVTGHPPLTSDLTLTLGIYPAPLGNDRLLIAIVRRSTELFTITYMGDFPSSFVFVLHLEGIRDFINLKRAMSFRG